MPQRAADALDDREEAQAARGSSARCGGALPFARVLDQAHQGIGGHRALVARRGALADVRDRERVACAHGPSAVAVAAAQVEVLVVEEEPLVEAAELEELAPANNEPSPRDPRRRGAGARARAPQRELARDEEVLDERPVQLQAPAPGDVAVVVAASLSF